MTHPVYDPDSYIAKSIDSVEWKECLKYFTSQINLQLYYTQSILELVSYNYWGEECAKPRNQNPKRLLRYGYKIYSQNDEDGQIEEIFKRIGIETATFVEIGVEINECNTAKLLADGWAGVWIEADEKSIEHMNSALSGYQGLTIVGARATINNINKLIGEGSRPLDLLSIDIDYNDYWLWKAIEMRPRVVVIEYNALWRPPMSVSVPYNEKGWDGSDFFGASLGALVKLGCEKGYKLVGCSFSGSNAFFVRDDLVGDKFLEPFTAEEHYEPPRYRFPLLSGNTSRFGPLVRV